MINLSDSMKVKLKEELRLKCFRMAPELLPILLRTGEAYRVHSGVPADAILVMASYDYQKNWFVLKFWSEAFEPLQEGWSVPITDIVMERLSPETVSEALAAPGLPLDESDIKRGLEIAKELKLMEKPDALH